MKKSGIIIASNSGYFTEKVREFLGAACKGENILVISGNDDIVETIQRTKPRIVFIESNCWHQVTALVIWECANKFPLLNIAVWNVEALTVEGAGRFICVGARSYIDIRNSIKDAREAFRTVASGNSYIPPDIEKAAAAYALPDTESPGLTSVEIKIIRLCFFGKSEREISDILNLSYGTVRVYIAKIYQKCALCNKCDGRSDCLLTDDKGLHGVIVFNDKEYDAFGWSIGERVKRGVLRAGSVGFRIPEIELPSKETQADGTALIFRRQELLEFSICNVPANPFALIKSNEQRAKSNEKNTHDSFYYGAKDEAGKNNFWGGMF